MSRVPRSRADYRPIRFWRAYGGCFVIHGAFNLHAARYLAPAGRALPREEETADWLSLSRDRATFTVSANSCQNTLAPFRSRYRMLWVRNPELRSLRAWNWQGQRCCATTATCGPSTRNVSRSPRNLPFTATSVRERWENLKTTYARMS